MCMTKEPISIRLNKKLINMIDKRIEKVGCGATRNGWIEQAIEKQLKIEMGVSYLFQK